MAGQETTPNEPPIDNPAPEAPPRPAETPQIVAVVEEPKGGEGKVVQVQHSDFKKIKDEAKEKGRRETLAELDAAATKFGFPNLEGALEALSKLNAKPVTPEPKTATPTQETKMPKKPETQQNPREADRAKREADRLAVERDKVRKQWRTSEKANREMKRKLDAQEAKTDLLREMHGAGVKDADYVMHLLSKEIGGKSVEEISKFDRKAFYEKVRTEQPYLFGEKVVAATTGTNGTNANGSQPAAPGAAAPVIKAAEAKTFNSQTATREDYEKRVRELGLNPHM